MKNFAYGKVRATTSEEGFRPNIREIEAKWGWES
jgi:hypothetical protein